MAEASGIHFRHDNAASSEKYLIETMGSGCGWIDYDQNGLLDLYLVNGAATRVYTPTHALRSALYRNNGDGTFTDVTEKAGVGAEGLFGMGVAVGDYDNDGFPDLFVLGYGRCILYHNEGNGTFRDVTQHAGVANLGRWASSAAWFDYDNDGRLDLVIANYIDWSPERNFWCGDHGPGMRSYCHPDDYNGEAPTLYRNNGDGTFTDVSKHSGIGAKPGNGLGVVTFDYDDDGWQDILIANDSMANFLFHNQRDGTFREVGYESGIAVSVDGAAEAGMGVDAADTTGSGKMDVIIGHLDMQLARFYRNLGHGTFEDATLRSKIGYATYHMSEFGALFLDYDNDGARDIFLANGHVLDNIARYHADVHYAEPKLMFRNLGRGIFQNVSDRLGADFRLPRVSRGAAVGDFDNDGDLDVLVSNNGQPPQLFRNDGGNAKSLARDFADRNEIQSRRRGFAREANSRRSHVLRPEKRRNELPVRPGSAFALRIGRTTQHRCNRSAMAERQHHEAFEPGKRSDCHDQRRGRPRQTHVPLRAFPLRCSQWPTARANRRSWLIGCEPK